MPIQHNYILCSKVVNQDDNLRYLSWEHLIIRLVIAGEEQLIRRSIFLLLTNFTKLDCYDLKRKLVNFFIQFNFRILFLYVASIKFLLLNLLFIVSDKLNFFFFKISLIFLFNKDFFCGNKSDFNFFFFIKDHETGVPFDIFFLAILIFLKFWLQTKTRSYNSYILF